jgi:hypothetical protein
VRRSSIQTSSISSTSGAEQEFRSNFEQEGSANQVREVHGEKRGAYSERRSARCEKCGVRSSQECGVANLGTDGPARRSSLLSPARWTGPPPIPRCGPPRATNRMTRPPRRSPPQEAARGFWIRAWGQREPASQGTGRSMTQHDGRASSRVGWTFPAPHANCNSLGIEHPIRTLTRCAWSRARRVGTLRLVQLLPPCRKGAARGSSAHRTRPWPQCRSRRG